MPALSSAFAPVSLSRPQAEKLESMMKQQVQDVILAHSAQLAKDNAMDADWKFVGSLGRLKTYKINGVDSFTSTSSWATTLTRSARATASYVNDRISTGGRHTWNIAPRGSSRHYGRQSRRRTTGGFSSRHDPLNPHPPLRSYRTFGRVQGNYHDIVGVHHAANSVDFVQQQKLMSPIVTNGAVLRTIRSTQDSYLGIKWLAENSFAGKRDYCFIEMVGYTTNTDGKEIGFVTVASVDIPECPDLSDTMKITRVRMKRTMLVIPTTDTPKVTSEVFVMGASESNDPSIIVNAQYRLNMAILNDISIVIDSQNLAKETLAPQQTWIPDQSRPTCTICSRSFNFMYRRRHHCRLCGDVICKTCYVTRAVPGVQEGFACRPSGICQTKFCVRCVMSLRAIDKRSRKLSTQASKMLSFNVDDNLNISETEIDQGESPFSPTLNLRDSSVTYFKRGTNKKRTLDLDQLYNIPVPPSQVECGDKPCGVSSRATVAVGGVGAFVAQSEADHLGTTSSKSMRPSLSVDPSNSGSYRQLSHLSRHSSSRSLTDSQCDPQELMELTWSDHSSWKRKSGLLAAPHSQVKLNIDTITRTVAI
ncbi:hypothetical protein PHYBOEH_001184 [Phytophthora boehmeriae]|uniref:FYVE-type domain-containing protein n=1 Tax=Phytophthora boehmeriae TaxID=109152 RepID=A0A8T1WUE1_9STRA|nr:hypothetical protein PHYBOEH_001184 [Phytophthora boehmeriae]